MPSVGSSFGVAKFAADGTPVWSRRIDHQDIANPAHPDLAVSPGGVCVLRGDYRSVSVDNVALVSDERALFAASFGP